jgi:putative RNA 2'-phosphotransferase
LLTALAAHGRNVDFAALERLVAESDKQRFAFSADRRRIRANQGHSVQVDLGLSPAQPPDILFHGTVARFLPSIHELGLLKGGRQHVHLSATRELALIVGARRGAPIVLEVDARAMTNAGHCFYLSTNGVWLTDHVPPQFLPPITAD